MGFRAVRLAVRLSACSEGAARHLQVGTRDPRETVRTQFGREDLVIDRCF